MVGVAHAFNRHYVGAFPVRLQFLVFFNLLHYLFKFSVTSIGYVENVRHSYLCSMIKDYLMLRFKLTLIFVDLLLVDAFALCGDPPPLI